MTHSTVAELAWARQCLEDSGIDSARADAEWLLGAVLGVDRGRLMFRETMTDAERTRFRADVAARTQRIPLQHIIGTAAFGPAELAVGPGVFIPRPETEFLVEWAVRQADSNHPDITVVDLCSGSGALAVAITMLMPRARTTAVELSDDALTWLRRNVDAAGPAVSSRITVAQADVTDDVAMSDIITPGSVDIVVSNPPYVPLASNVGPEVVHDPRLAVFGGTDGMSVIDPMVPVIATMLRDGGVVGIEHDDTTSERVVAAFAAHGGFVDITPRDDLAGRSRFVTARRAR